MGVYIWLNRLIDSKKVDKKLEKIAFGYRATWWYKILFPFKSIPCEPKDTKYYRAVVNWLNAFGLIVIVVALLSKLFEYYFVDVFGCTIIYMFLYLSANKIYLGFEKDIKNIAIRRFEEEGREEEAKEIRETLDL